MSMIYMFRYTIIHLTLCSINSRLIIIVCILVALVFFI